LPPFTVLLVGAGEQAWESRGPSILALSGEGVELSALVAPREEQRLGTARSLGVERTYASMTDALAVETYDGVVLAVPDRLHEPLTIEALEAGCHVLCEKPMALHAAGARRMLEAARRANRVLVIGYHYPWMHPGLAELSGAGHFDSVFRAEAEWLRAGPLPPQPARWNQPRLGAAGDLLGHLLSVLLIAIRSAPTRVTAHTWSHFGRRAHGDGFKGHDTVEALVAFGEQQAAHLIAGWERTTPVRESISLTLDGTDVWVRVPLMGRARDVERFRLEVHQRAGAAPIPAGVTERLPVQTEDAFVLQARDWVDAARGGGQPRFTAEDGLTIQAILDAVAASAEQGGEQIIM
jgi:predicted dehydrogenase